ncbi:hypothetical protein SAMN05421676_11360 [Salinibacillus kushneri]|uniref:Uncharacterized protein n=1 Tax=Salinibacillus kushneri TaxID=237682 RepID=A0A1I0IRB4_9BACI|nr:hypothetical protein [Salinibacillus kushneri]SET99024.1 hypothetical protein SAMN05421676_11360 [Salinibacillus kushneri]
MKITPDNAQFAAYTRLTLSARFQKHIKYGTKFGGQSNDIGFSQFKEILEKEKVVNEKNVRDMSSFHEKALQVQMNYGKNPSHTLKVWEVMDKAFQLGLVDNDETLLNRINSMV